MELLSVHRELGAAQLGLYRRSKAEKMYPKPEQEEQWVEWNKILAEQGGDDPLTKRIADSNAAIRERFGKHLRPNLWQLFGMGLSFGRKSSTKISAASQARRANAQSKS